MGSGLGSMSELTNRMGGEERRSGGAGGGGEGGGARKKPAFIFVLVLFAEE